MEKLNDTNRDLFVQLFKKTDLLEIKQKTQNDILKLKYLLNNITDDNLIFFITEYTKLLHEYSHNNNLISHLLNKKYQDDYLDELWCIYAETTSDLELLYYNNIKILDDPKFNKLKEELFTKYPEAHLCLASCCYKNNYNKLPLNYDLPY